MRWRIDTNPDTVNDTDPLVLLHAIGHNWCESKSSCTRQLRHKSEDVTRKVYIEG